jgi:hypothetical protein
MKEKKPTVSRTIAPDRYWRLRALLKDMAGLPSEMQAELQRQQAQMQDRINEAMKDAGLDPKKVYHLNDVDLTATPQP